LTRFFSNKVESVAASSNSATAKAEQDASQALLSRPDTAAEPSLTAGGGGTVFRDDEDSEPQTLELFAIATQEPCKPKADLNRRYFRSSISTPPNTTLWPTLWKYIRPLDGARRVDSATYTCPHSDRLSSEIEMLLTDGKDGGLHTMIGRKRR
jgi:hypothetical protein